MNMLRHQCKPRSCTTDGRISLKQFPILFLFCTPEQGKTTETLDALYLVFEDTSPVLLAMMYVLNGEG